MTARIAVDGAVGAGSSCAGEEVGVLVEIRPAARLRGKNAIDLAAALTPALGAVIADDEVDLSRLRVTADWVQYRK